jgi:hypothetical protein
MKSKDKGRREKKKPAISHISAQSKVVPAHRREDFGQAAVRIVKEGMEG